MLVVFDLELTAWLGSAARGWTGPGEYPEIIQIGAVRLDAGLCETGTLDLPVKPRLNPTLSDYIVDLTGIAQGRIDREGVDIAEALGRLADFAEGARVLLCNGGDDAWLRQNARLAGIPDPLAAATFGSLSRHFSRAAARDRHVVSSDLPAVFGFAAPGRAHDGLGDARAIAEALRRTLPDGGVEALVRSAVNEKPT